MSTPRLVVPSEIVLGTHTSLGQQSIRHIRALRLTTGSEVVLTDGAGLQRRAVLLTSSSHEASVRLLPDTLPDNESPLHLALCLAQYKWDRLEWAIEKATELGVREFRLVLTHRSPHMPASGRLERLARIAISATEQAQRRFVPTIHPPSPLIEALHAFPSDAIRLFAHEEGRYDHDARPLPQHTDRAAIMIGPAGGFTPQEAADAAALGWQLTSFGPRILRSETAAIVAATLAQSRWGDLRR